MRDQRERPGPDDGIAADAAALRAAGFRGDSDAAIPGRPAAWVLDPDLPAVLDALAGLGVRLGVVSNLDGTLDARLRGWGLRRRFGHMAFAGAPDALGVGPGECLHVGDRPGTDVAGALAAGVTRAV